MKRVRSEEERVKNLARMKVAYQKKREVLIEASTLYRKEMSLTSRYRVRRMLGAAKTRSVMKNVPFDIDFEYLIDLWESQDGACCICGRPFDLEPAKERVNKNAPSLDRIIPELGYTKGNVRFVSWQVNAAISEYGLENFMNICKDVIEFNKGIT